ncbi:hypothetical protein ARALYDRAFT_896898 [Arabidopsis lyrata subsp. lyrata]|uniref:U-box domain-containing protein n=1 Tax=Arabidopsis lyrata subsp. lyrata TaxID=81972 RepID=D7L6J6_ARALL|nr:hypothetical protein ARALYDRAFT_896898 [Arabidopsis lyrata subsp. lyrata]
MAKTGVFDSDPTAIAKAKELKREMKKLLIKIEDEDDFGVQTIDQLQEALSALREATMRKMAKSSSLEMLETVSCPEEFRCPLSNELMRDPVVLASGQQQEARLRNPCVIPLLIDALRRGTVATRSNAAAAIFTLSALDSNKVLIGKSGILKPLIDLLEEGNPLAIKDVAAAIFTLCIAHENRSRAVRDGAVRVLGKKISNGLYVDELLAILAMLVTHWKAVEELGELGGVSWLLKITRESECKRNKENAIVILHTICFSDRTKWKEIKEEENAHGTITKLSREGTSRAQRKANGILDRLRKAMNLTHTA